MTEIINDLKYLQQMNLGNFCCENTWNVQIAEWKYTEREKRGTKTYGTRKTWNENIWNQKNMEWKYMEPEKQLMKPNIPIQSFTVKRNQNSNEIEYYFQFV